MILENELKQAEAELARHMAELREAIKMPIIEASPESPELLRLASQLQKQVIEMAGNMLELITENQRLHRLLEERDEVQF
jgi:F0F1-type ATP synthase delta subunit